jgi:hypothetical protein
LLKRAGQEQDLAAAGKRRQARGTWSARDTSFAAPSSLIDLELPDDPDSRWLSQGGREMAAAVLLPRAEAALRQELQRLADAAKRARQGQSSSSSGSRSRQARDARSGCVRRGARHARAQAQAHNKQA